MKNIKLEKPFVLKDIELLEKRYLDEIVFLLHTEMDKLCFGLNTKEDIRKDWQDVWSKNRSENKKGVNKNLSDFATGAERIYYWIFNQFGIPNSTPVGSDLLFERVDAYIHIDIKSVSKSNIRDIKNNIFIGLNQNSYSGEMLVKNEKRKYLPNLPEIYTKVKNNKIKYKPCLTYFIILVHDDDLHNLLAIILVSMPNGALHSVYKDDILQAGKNPGEARFRFKEAEKFKLLDNEPYRINVVTYNEEYIDDNIKKYLEYYKDIFNKQEDNFE